MPPFSSQWCKALPCFALSLIMSGHAHAESALLTFVDAGKPLVDLRARYEGVDEVAIIDAIRTRRVTTVAEIGTTLRAGTNCGSCIPELSALLTGSLRGPMTADAAE